MAKIYRSVQQWNHWLSHFLGKNILEVEQQFLFKLYQDQCVNHAILVGVPTQQELLNSFRANNCTTLGPLINKNFHFRYIEAGFYELPLFSGSVDVVIVPHTLEFLDNPQKLLHEACRVVKPGGDIIILGFNPISLWGLKKWLMKNKVPAWSDHFIAPTLVKKWLALMDFELVKQNKILFRPPIHHQLLFKKLKILDWLGEKFNAFFGGIYVIVAKAKTCPLTPIKLHWKQPLAPLSGVFSGPTMNDNTHKRFE